MASRPHVSPLGVVLVLGAGCLWPLAVEAAVVTTAAVGFSNSASVTDAEGGSATASTDVSLGSSAVTQFDAALGVLTGATLNLTSTRTQSAWVKSTAGGGQNANFDVTSNGEGSSTARLTAPGVDTSFSQLAATDSCTDKWKNDCIGSSTSGAGTATNSSNSVSAGSLGSYVGTGAVTVTRSSPTLSAHQIGAVFSGTETTTSALTWSGTLSATYEYLLHAAPSFSAGSQVLELSHDFGTVTLNQDAAPWSFDIFNLAALDRVGLDLDSIVGAGDFAKFLLTGLSSFAGLAPGTGSDYWVDFDTSALGAFSATYYFNMSDADVGAASSRYPYQLVLSLSGNVVNPVTREIEPRNNVPEPATLALFTLGIATLPLVRRRRTPS